MPWFMDFQMTGNWQAGSGSIHASCPPTFLPERSIVVVYMLWEHGVRVRFSALRKLVVSIGESAEKN